MSAARTGVLAAIRSGLGRGPLDAAAAERLAAGMAEVDGGAVPARGRPPPGECVARFRENAEAVSATVTRIAAPGELPGAVAEYLAARNLPARILATPDPFFDRVPWDRRPALEVRRGAHGEHDIVGLSRAFAAVAETGSLAMAGGADNPHLASFVPETQIAVVPAQRIVGAFEDVRAMFRGGGLPRTLSLVTGPSRTGDIGLKIELGAHGPRRLHIVIVDDDRALNDDEAANDE